MSFSIAPVRILLAIVFTHCSAAAAVGDGLEEMHVASGDRVRLECRVPSNAAVVFWLRNDRIFSTDREIFSESTDGMRIQGDDDATFDLVFESVTTDDEGVYQCQVPPDTSPLTNIRLRVNVRPVIMLFYPASEHVDIQSGDTLQLECRANGKPAPHIHWTRTDQNGSEEQQQQATQLGTPTLLVAKVTVDDVTSRESGFYRCVADNGVGMATRGIQVNIVYAPTVTILGQSHSAGLHVGLNDVIELVCVVTSNPPAEIRWTHNSMDIRADKLDHISFSSRITEEGDVSILRVHSVQTDDVGLYTCRATNRLGSNEDSLVVTGIPDNVLITGDDMGIHCDQFTLEWTVRSMSDLVDVQIRINSHASYDRTDRPDETIQVDSPVVARDDYGQRALHYTVAHLSPNTLYALVLRTSNPFGYSQWTPKFYFETAEACGTTSIVHTAPPPTTAQLKKHSYRAHPLQNRSSIAIRDAVCRLLTLLPAVLLVCVFS